MAPFCNKHMLLNIDGNILIQALCRLCYTEGVNTGKFPQYEFSRTTDFGRAASSSQDTPAVPDEEVVKEEIDTDDDAPGSTFMTKEELERQEAEMTHYEAQYDAYVNRRQTTGPTLQQVRGIGARARSFVGSRNRKVSVPIRRR